MPVHQQQQQAFKILNNIDAVTDLPTYSMSVYPAFLRSVIPDLLDMYLELWDKNKKTFIPNKTKIQAAMAEAGFQELEVHKALTSYRMLLDAIRHSSIGETDSFQTFEGQYTPYYFKYGSNKGTTFKMMMSTKNHLNELAGSIYILPHCIAGIALTLGAKSMIKDALDMGCKLKVRDSVSLKIDDEIKNFDKFVEKRELHLIIEFGEIWAHERETTGDGTIYYNLPLKQGGA